MEHRHPETGAVVVRDTFSFCNHNGFPDEMLVEMAGEVFHELQLLKTPLPPNVTSAMASLDAWPKIVPVIQHKYSDPAINQIFQQPIGGPKGSCNRCNVSGLRKLSQYYHFHDQQDSQSTPVSEEFAVSDREIPSLPFHSTPEKTAVSEEFPVSDREIPSLPFHSTPEKSTVSKEFPVSDREIPFHSTTEKTSNSCHREVSELYPSFLSVETPNPSLEASGFPQSPVKKVPNSGEQALDLYPYAPTRYSFREPISAITYEIAGLTREVSTSPSFHSSYKTSSENDSSFVFSEYLDKISFQSRSSYTLDWLRSSPSQSSSSF